MECKAKVRTFLKDVPPNNGFHIAEQETNNSRAGWGGIGDGSGRGKGEGPSRSSWPSPQSLMILRRYKKKLECLAIKIQ